MKQLPGGRRSSNDLNNQELMATPAYLRAMEAVGLEDLACEGDKEWLTAIERMMDDETLRHDVGQAGKEYTDSFYSEEVLLARWDATFSSIGFSFNKDV